MSNNKVVSSKKVSKKEYWKDTLLSIYLSGDTVALVDDKPTECSATSCKFCSLNIDDDEYECGYGGCSGVLGVRDWCEEEIEESTEGNTEENTVENTASHTSTNLKVDSEVFVRGLRGWIPAHFAAYNSDGGDSILVFPHRKSEWTDMGEGVLRWYSDWMPAVKYKDSNNKSNNKSNKEAVKGCVSIKTLLSSKIINFISSHGNVKFGVNEYYDMFTCTGSKADCECCLLSSNEGCDGELVKFLSEPVPHSIKKDSKVIIEEKNGDWIRAHLAEIDGEGGILVYPNGETSHTYSGDGLVRSHNWEIIEYVASEGC